jgi:hypothetical protein
MKRYAICVVERAYRYVEVEAEDETDAKDKVWADIENIINKKAEDYDTDVIVDGFEEISL